MNIVVTGGEGQLAKSLKERIDIHNSKLNLAEISGLFPSRGELDITDERKAKSFFKDNKPDIVINCAAYTSVDLAECEKEKAFLTNAEGVRILCECANESHFKIIHISTDYVFDGLSSSPYKESDTMSPLSIYGKTKAQGEETIKALNPEGIIIRTGWLYSGFGHNFFLTMRAKALRGLPVKVVADQIGTPTSASDLADALIYISTYKNWEKGIYHFSNEGEATWYEFAREIYRMHGADADLVSPVTTEAYSAAAPRPRYSVLDKDMIKTTFGIKISPWQESLEKLIKRSDF